MVSDDSHITDQYSNYKTTRSLHQFQTVPPSLPICNSKQIDDGSPSYSHATQLPGNPTHDALRKQFVHSTSSGVPGRARKYSDVYNRSTNQSEHLPVDMLHRCPDSGETCILPQARPTRSPNSYCHHKIKCRPYRCKNPTWWIIRRFN